MSDERKNEYLVCVINEEIDLMFQEATNLLEFEKFELADRGYLFDILDDVRALVLRLEEINSTVRRQEGYCSTED